MICDGHGLPFSFRLTPGQAHELPQAEPLLRDLPRPPQWVVADKGYAANSFRELIWNLGSKPAVPTKSNEAPVDCPAWIYNNRHLIENAWAKLKAAAGLILPANLHAAPPSAVPLQAPWRSPEMATRLVSAGRRRRPFRVDRSPPRPDAGGLRIPARRRRRRAG